MAVFQVDAELRNPDGFIVAHAGFLIPSLSPDLGKFILAWFFLSCNITKSNANRHHLLGLGNYYTMLFPRVLPYYPFGLYCVFQKGANLEACPSNIMADDFVRLRHIKNNTLCDIQHMTPDPQSIPTIVLDHANLSHNFPLHNVEVSKVLSLKKVTAGEVQNLPQFDSEHHCTSRNCIVDALDIDILSRTDPAFTKYEYLDLALYPAQIDTLFDVSVLRARAEVAASEATAIGPLGTTDAVIKRDETIVTAAQPSITALAEVKASSTPLQKVLDLMKASPSKVPAPTTAGMEVFDSSVVEYGPIKTRRSHESNSTTHQGLTMKSGGHTPNTSISSTFPEKMLHEDSRAASSVTSYPKAFVQSESPFTGIDATDKLRAPLAAPPSSSSNVPNTTSVMDWFKSSSAYIEAESVPDRVTESGKTLLEAQEEETKPIKKSHRKKGRERKAAQALRKEQKAIATASSADNITIKKEAINGSASSTAPLPEVSTLEAKPNDDNTVKETQPVTSKPLTKSQRKKIRQRKGKIAKEVKQQQESAAAALESSSSNKLNVLDSSRLISQDQAESETLKQPDQEKKASNHAKPGKKATVISKSALLAKANGVPADNMPDNKAKTQYSLGSLVQPGRPRPKASAMPEPESAKMPTLAEFSFEAPALNSNTPPREPHSASTSYLLGNVANPVASGSRTPPFTKPVNPPSSAVFDPVFASPPPKIKPKGRVGAQPSSDCPLRLTESTVKAKELASVHHDDSNISQTTTNGSNEEAGSAGTGAQAANDESQAGLNDVTSAIDQVITSTSEEVITAQSTAATADEEVGILGVIASPCSDQDRIEVHEQSNIADTANKVDKDTVAQPTNIAAHNKGHCAWMDGAYPNLRQDHNIRDHVFFSLSNQPEVEYPQYVPEAHVDQSPEMDVAAETPAEAGLSSDDATKSLINEEPRTDEESLPAEELPASSTNADIVSDTESSQEQASIETNVDQRPTLVTSTSDKGLYEFSDADKVPSSMTLPQNCPDHIDDVDQQSTGSEQARPELNPVPDVLRSYDPAFYESWNNERPTDLTMPQNRPDIVEVAHDPLSPHESSDNKRPQDSTMPQIRSGDLEDVAEDSLTEDSSDRYVVTAEDEDRLKTLGEQLVEVFKVVKQHKKSENSSRITSGSLSVGDGLESLPSVTSVGTRTGDTSPSDPAPLVKADAPTTMSPAATDGLSLSADQSAQATHGKIHNIDGAQPFPHSSTKVLSGVANSLYITSCGLPKEKNDVRADEVPASVWVGKQAFRAVKVTVAVTLLPVSLAVEAAMVPIRATKTACLITRWAMARFGPSWLV